MKYCAVDNPEIDDLVEKIMQDVAAGIDLLPAELRCELAAVVLGGGYGRGEGGVFHAPDGSERLYNDLDLFVFTRTRTGRSMTRRLAAALLPIEEELSRRYDVEVEFGPPTAVADFARLAPTLMYQELVRGWKPVWGNDEIMAKLPELPLSELPLSEGMRLLVNRGAGLLMARARLHQHEDLPDSEEDCDFIIRNMHKAALAVGDAWLIARHRYEFGVKRRLEILESDPAFPGGARADYRAAVDFKYAPSPSLLRGEDLLSQWQKYAGEWCAMLSDYRHHYRPEPEPGIVNCCRNFLKNLIYLPGTDRGWLWLAPRERFMMVLPDLLFDKMPKKEYIKLLVPFWRISGMERDLARLKGRFLKLWERFN